MNLPEWFLDGAVTFASEVWDSHYDNQMKDILYSGRYLNFMEFARDNPQLAGFSLFHFVHKKYNLKTISNLIYLTRINRSVESGFLYVFGKTFYQVIGTDWFNYYSKKYGTGNKRRYPTKGKLALNIPKRSTLHHVSLSPNAKKIAISYSSQGVCHLIVQDLVSQQSLHIDKIGEIGPIAYETRTRFLFDWISDAKLSYAYFSNGQLKLTITDIGSKKKSVQKIKDLNDIAYIKAKTTNHFLLVASKKGISNIYEYRRGRLKPLTNDLYVQKEVDLYTFNEKEGIIYTAIPYEKNVNEPFYDIPNGQNADIFFKSFDGSVSINVTQSPLTNECNLQFQSTTYLFVGLQRYLQSDGRDLVGKSQITIYRTLNLILLNIKRISSLRLQVLVMILYRLHLLNQHAYFQERIQITVEIF